MGTGPLRAWRGLLAALFACTVAAIAVAPARAAVGDRFLETARIVAPTSGPSAEVGEGKLGFSSAISADATTAVVGAREDNAGVGAAYVYVRTGGQWVLQAKLIAPTSGGAKETGAALFGDTVAISADGNTVLVGGFRDTTNAGAVWAFTRTGVTWTLQQRLTAPTAGPDAAVGATSQFGISLSLAADGNTALIGANNDGTTGAAWTFTRSGATWTEQHKFVPPAGADAAVGNPAYGFSVALTSDAARALIGGPSDATFTGAAWAYDQSGGTWTEVAKLTPPATGGDVPVGEASFGHSVALSADGTTAILAAPFDANNRGAAWVYRRSGAAFTEQAKLVAPSTGPDAQSALGELGESVALTADGTRALLGADGDQQDTGAVYLFDTAGAGWTMRQRIVAPGGADSEIGPEGVFGGSLGLTPDGSQLLIGAPLDHTNLGAFWSYSSTAPPTVSSVSPASGPPAGGIAVAVHGAGFAASGNDAVSAVAFGGVPATSFVVASSTEIDAVVPAHPAGTVDVIVSAPAGDSAIGPGDQFTFAGAPAAAPPAPPTVPAGVHARSGHGRAIVSFTPSTGAGPIVYTVTASPGGAHASGVGSPITVGGLHNGRHYTFTVTAAGAAGSSAASSPSRAVTPFAAAKVANASLSGVGGHTSLSLTLRAPKGSPKLRTLTVHLPGGLRVVADGVHLTRPVHGRSSVRHGTLTITLTRPAATVHLTVGGSASRALVHRVQRHPRLAIALLAVDSAGNATALTVRVRAR